MQVLNSLGRIRVLSLAGLVLTALLVQPAYGHRPRTFTVTTTATSGPGSLMQAILDANVAPGLDTITFDIPGLPPFLIDPPRPLPPILDPVVIDGTSQPGFSGSPIVEIRAVVTGTALTITSGGCTIRGLAISYASEVGIHLIGGGSNVIEGNHIGTDVAGTQSFGGAVAIQITDSASNTIGGTAAASRNVLVGRNWSLGIEGAASTGNIISGNYIGVGADGSTGFEQAGAGISIVDGAHDNTIGGTAPGAGNIIAFNGGNGIQIGSGSGNRISSNSIHSNGALGIDLGFDGVTPNDVRDADTGPNDLQNYPVLMSAFQTPLSVTIVGAMDGTPDAALRLEFFASPVAHPSGFGEGRTFIGAAEVRIDAFGLVDFSVTLPATIPPGSVVTSTATSSLNNTSEFSRAIALVTDGAPPTVLINQAADQADPAREGPIRFTVIFSEPVQNFGPAAVALSGSAGATMTSVTGGPTTFEVAVSGMVRTGTVIATVLPGAVVDAAGNLNEASGSTDNTVFFDPDQPCIDPVFSSSLDAASASRAGQANSRCGMTGLETLMALGILTLRRRARTLPQR